MVETMISLADKVLDFVKRRGYVLTRDVVNEFKVSSVIAGAMLSQLVSRGLLAVSHLKVGSGPVYYIPSQKSKLETFSTYLKGIEKEAFELLKQHKLLKDSDLPPALRVALSNIKDFAVLIEVINPKGESERYWKFYNVTNDDVKRILSERFNEQNKEQKTQPAQPNQQHLEKPLENKTEESKAATSAEKTGKPEKQPNEDKQITLEEPEEKPNQETKLFEEKPKGFIAKVVNFFNQNNIKILNSNIIKKDKEAEFTVLYESPLGNTSYYVYCIDKKRISDKDISPAYLEALNKRLPLVFITSGDLTKKAKEQISTKFKGSVIKKLV